MSPSDFAPRWPDGPPEEQAEFLGVNLTGRWIRVELPAEPCGHFQNAKPIIVALQITTEDSRGIRFLVTHGFFIPDIPEFIDLKTAYRGSSNGPFL